MKPIFVTIIACALLAAGAAAAVEPPVAPVRPVSDTYFGEKIVDPYRWMEARTPEFEAWARAQDAVTRQELSMLPGREALRERIAAFTAANTSPTNPDVNGDQIYFLKRPSGAAMPRLYVRSRKGGVARLLVNPETITDSDGAVSVGTFKASPDNRYLAYTLTSGGSEEATLHVMDLRSGRVLPEAIDRARFARAVWAPDGRSFIYVRLQAPTAGAAQKDRFSNLVLWRHVVGQDPRADTAVFEATRPDDESGSNGFPISFWAPGGRWVFVFVDDGVSSQVQAWVSPAAAVLAGKPTWRKVASLADEMRVSGLGGSLDAWPVVRGDRAWIATTRGAPLGKIVSIDLKTDRLADGQEASWRHSGLLGGMYQAADGVYLIQSAGGLDSASRVDWSGRSKTVRLPASATVHSASANPERPGFVAQLESWTRPGEFYAVATGAPARSLGLADRFPLDLSQVVSERIIAHATDGTAIPVDIVRLKTLPRNGRAPTVIYGYGAYGNSSSPQFLDRWMPFVLRGGIFASAVVRGGGEFGESWHLAGKLANKPNTWRDFIAAAETLIAKGYTSKGRLAAEGSSAGGILIGRAITERPDLFAAAFMGVPVSDGLRFETTEGGPANIGEFGSTKTEAGYRALKAMSPYANVKDGTHYPPILITAGFNDHRVPAWVPAKMAARLQAATTGGSVRLRVDFDAGHGIGSSKAQRDELTADMQAFLLHALGDPEFQPKP